MSLAIIGTLAYDSIETPFKSADNLLGGSANYAALAARYLTPDVGVVGIVGEDYRSSDLDLLTDRGIDVSGVEIREGAKTFRWSGRYHLDLNTRDTLDTQLNVLLEFDPNVPEHLRSSRFVCLGNFDPTLQEKTLDQFSDPAFTLCDTMNFWIENTPNELRRLLRRVDCLVVNDSEARQLADTPSLIKAARIIREMGPKVLVIKKGEHGALLFVEDEIFSAPAYPLEDIHDPTGAGDAFAGGFIGYLARRGEVTTGALRSAVVHGSAIASFCVEKFSVEGLLDLDHERVDRRLNVFRHIAHFELDQTAVGNAAA